MEAVKLQTDTISYLSENLRNNKELGLIAVKQSPISIKYLSENLKNDVEIGNILLNKKFEYIQYLGENLRNDKRVMKMISTTNPELLIYLGNKLKNDKEFIIELLIDNPECYKYIDSNLKDDDDVLRKVLNSNSEAFKYISDKIDIKNNKQKYQKLAFLLLNTDILNKLKNKYYKSYFNQIASKYPDKDNDFDFFCALVKSKTLNSIYASDDFTISEIKNIEVCICNMYTGEEKKLVEEKINKIILLNRTKITKFLNDINNHREDKEYVVQLLHTNNLTEDKVINFIANNKFLDNISKRRMLTIINSIFYPERVKNNYYIFEMLEEMNSRNISLDNILNERNIDKAAFESLYREAKELNPILYRYMKDSLNAKRIELEFFIENGYQVLNSTITSIEKYEKKIGKNIFDFINQYKETELYDLLINKFSQLDNSFLDEFESYNLNGQNHL